MQYQLYTACGRLVLGLGLILCVSGPLSTALAGPTSNTAPAAPKRWAQFDLVSTEPDGSVQAGKDVVLSITLGGCAAWNRIRHGYDRISWISKSDGLLE